MSHIVKSRRNTTSTLAVECLEERVNPVSFAPLVGYQASEGATQIAYGDFLGNGRTDVVVAPGIGL